MSRSVFDVILLNGSAHVVEADKFHADATGRSVTFVRGGENVAQFFNVSSGVKRPATPDPVPSQFLCASAVAELGMVDLQPSVSIGAINITVGSIDEARAVMAAATAEARNHQAAAR